MVVVIGGARSDSGSRAIFVFRWVPVLVSLVVVLVGLGVGLVVGGGCRWGRRRLVKRPVRNMLGLSRRGIGFGSRGRQSGQDRQNGGTASEEATGAM